MSIIEKLWIFQEGSRVSQLLFGDCSYQDANVLLLSHTKYATEILNLTTCLAASLPLLLWLPLASLVLILVLLIWTSHCMDVWPVLFGISHLPCSESWTYGCSSRHSSLSQRYSWSWSLVVLVSHSSLLSYTDADWCGCPKTHRSTSGYCVFLGDDPISWTTKRKPT